MVERLRFADSSKLASTCTSTTTCAVLVVTLHTAAARSVEAAVHEARVRLHAHRTTAHAAVHVLVHVVVRASVGHHVGTHSACAAPRRHATTSQTHRRTAASIAIYEVRRRSWTDSTD